MPRRSKEAIREERRAADRAAFQQAMAENNATRERNAAINRRTLQRTGRKTHPLDMAGDGVAYDQRAVWGPKGLVQLSPGVEIEIGSQSRIIRNAAGEVVAIPGGEGSPLTIRDLIKIDPKLAREAQKANRISRERRKKKLRTKRGSR